MKTVTSAILFIIVHLTYDNNTITTGHKWHVHDFPVTSDCMSCGGHYNPYTVNMVSTRVRWSRDTEREK